MPSPVARQRKRSFPLVLCDKVAYNVGAHPTEVLPVAYAYTLDVGPCPICNRHPGIAHRYGYACSDDCEAIAVAYDEPECCDGCGSLNFPCRCIPDPYEDDVREYEEILADNRLRRERNEARDFNS